MRERLPYLSIALLSSSALAYEILLIRLFSINQWHHFAYMVIALALLGYGVSGTIITVTQKILLPQFRQFYLISILLFAISSLVSFRFAQDIPFNAEEILWAKYQIIYLAKP